jgi:hypothetical protein
MCYTFLMKEDILDKLIKELGYEEAMKELALLAGYVSTPPTIDEFIDDPYFCGSFLGDGIWPGWRTELRKIYPNPFHSPYAEICITGGIGVGKSLVCKVGLLYDLCKLLHLKDPHETFGLLPSKPIVFAFMNATLKLADSVLFREFNEWLRTSPFFREQAKKIKQRKNAIAVDFPHNIKLISGSKGTHALGADIYSGMLSELNFQGESHSMQAFNQYTQVLRRIESRFFKGFGYMSPGRLWLDSSKTDELGFLEQHIKKAHANPKSLVIEKAIWDLGKVELTGKKFWVFKGDQSRDPMVLPEDFSHLGLAEANLMEVPIEYADSFKADIFGSLRDIAGVSTWSSHKAFHSVEKLVKSMNRPLGTSKYEIELDADDPNDHIINYVDTSCLDPKAAYYVHLDMAYKLGDNRTGIAFTRCMGQIQVSRINNLLEPQIVQENIYQTDLVLAIIPKPGKETPLVRCRNFIINLVHKGFKIGGVSSDSFQSKETMQFFQSMGYLADEVSVDLNREAYDYFIRSVNEERWTGPNHPILQKELLEIVDTGKKFDHPAIAQKVERKFRPSKDCADAVVGSVWFCHQNSRGGAVLTALENFVEYKNMGKTRPKTLKEELQALQSEVKRLSLHRRY